LTVYASTEIHSCNQKAVELLGLGTNSLRKVPVNDDFTINLNALEEALSADRAAGYRPICIIGSAGTVNTGAVDDLNALADLCKREELWFHWMAHWNVAVPENVPSCGIKELIRLRWIFTMDAWAFFGCILVRYAEAHRRTFHDSRISGMNHVDSGGNLWFRDFNSSFTAVPCAQGVDVNQNMV
jgi:hypothetical protein